MLLHTTTEKKFQNLAASSTHACERFSYNESSWVSHMSSLKIRNLDGLTLLSKHDGFQNETQKDRREVQSQRLVTI